MVTSTSRVSDKEDLLQAMDSVLDFLTATARGPAPPEQHQVLHAYYKTNRDRVETGGPPTEHDTAAARCLLELPSPRSIRSGRVLSGARPPAANERRAGLRYLVFLCDEIKKHEKAGRLNLATVHDSWRKATTASRLARQAGNGSPLVQAIPAATTSAFAEANPAARASAAAAPQEFDRAIPPNPAAT